MQVHDMPAAKDTISTQLEAVLTNRTQTHPIGIRTPTHEGTVQYLLSIPHPVPDNCQSSNQAYLPMTNTHHTHGQAHEVPQIVMIGTKLIVETTQFAGTLQLNADQPHHLVNNPKTTQLMADNSPVIREPPDVRTSIR